MARRWVDGVKEIREEDDGAGFIMGVLGEGEWGRRRRRDWENPELG
jgi:hypothetical protein